MSVECCECGHFEILHGKGIGCTGVIKRTDESISKLCRCKEFKPNRKSTDRLDEIFAIQKELTDMIKPNPYFEAGIEERIERLCTATLTEVVELRDCMNWKWWKKTKKPVDWEHAKEELIDCWHFMIQLSIEIGMNPEDIVEEYRRKNDINKERMRSGY